MKQVICECGRIAEVRRRKNGKKLRFTNCTECGTNLGNTKSAAILEQTEQDDIGIKGEFFKAPDTTGSNLENLDRSPEVSSPTLSESNSKPKAAQLPATTEGDWKPAIDELPENLEPATNSKPNLENSKTTHEPDNADKSEDKPGGGLWWRVLVGVAAVGFIGGGVYLGKKGGVK